MLSSTPLFWVSFVTVPSLSTKTLMVVPICIGGWVACGHLPSNFNTQTSEPNSAGRSGGRWALSMILSPQSPRSPQIQQHCGHQILEPSEDKTLQLRLAYSFYFRLTYCVLSQSINFELSLEIYCYRVKFYPAIIFYVGLTTGAKSHLSTNKICCRVIPTCPHDGDYT